MKKENIWSLVIGFVGCMLGLYGVILFNQYVLMALPLVARMIAMIVSYWLIAVVPIILMILGKDKLSDYGFAKEKVWNQIVIGLVIAVVMSAVLTVIPHIAGFGQYVDTGKRYQYAWQFIYEFVYCVAAIGAVEEFVFRGFIYHKMKTKFKTDMSAVIGSSILFGLFHLFSGNVVQMVMTALLGVVWCICRNKIKNCSTLSLIVAHGVYDALITVWACCFL